MAQAEDARVVSTPNEDVFDLVVIGSGPAGEKGAVQSAYYGHRVAVVERRADPGGSAIAVSGVPVKALRDAAMYLTGWSRREVFGVGMSLPPELVMEHLRAHVTEVVTTLSRAVRANLERHGVEIVHGEATLGPGRTVLVRDASGHERRLTAGVILLATGSRPFHPAGLPFDDPGVHDSETFLSVEQLPQRMVVVGGGPVGSEYASIFSALGSQVTVIDRGTRLLPFLDADISGALADSMRRSGARLMFEAAVESVQRGPDGLVVHVDGEALPADVVLQAVGREGNLAGLGLAEAGVEVEGRGKVRVDARFQTTAEGIYAAGDIIGPPGLASVSMEQARVAMCRAFDIPYKEALDPFVPTGIYTLPEVSMVGLTEEAARAAGEDVGTGSTLFSGNARATIAGSTEGMLKLVFRRSDRRLLGAHIVGEDATELIHVAQAVLHRDGVLDDFVDTTFNFPTRADAYKYAAYDGLPQRASTLRR